jgi:hypothetical protein
LEVSVAGATKEFVEATFEYDPHQKFNMKQLGEELAPGFFAKQVVLPTPRQSVQVPVEKIKPKTLAEREEIVQNLAARLMDWYIAELNNPRILNPIRDGVPQCRNHPFVSGKSYGCFYSCGGEAVLPPSRDHTLGDVFEWVTRMMMTQYQYMLKKKPELRGYLT